MTRSFDIVVVGAGHAGAEAALAAARLGRRVALVTLSRQHIAQLSCNPAIGGLAKGQLVREIDALGGAMARVTDASTIQFRRLNTRKGLAVQASRAQVDIHRYPRAMAATLDGQVEIIEDEAISLLTAGSSARGVGLARGGELRASAVILTTGTFLRGLMHLGPQQTQGGRIGEAPAAALSDDLRAHGLRLGRLKTGTTPRLDTHSIDWDRVQLQDDTDPSGHFSFTPQTHRLPTRACHITWTTPHTHALIQAALDRSPLFNGVIEGTGPRYCPSIEDKVVRFADRQRHQLFLEPEGLDTDRVYVNGLSTSLPADVQEAVVHSIPGLERARIIQLGYAIEYDFSDPRDLDHGLQHRQVPGLYLAGQVNGTSGYEEAAAQGLIAGASAALGEPLLLGREQAYIGVLVDDLVTRGVGGEPYRMFSSRAEHRLLLREDNADRRLMPRAHELGLLAEDVWERFREKRDAIEQIERWAEATPVRPDATTTARFQEHGLTPPRKATTAAELLRRPELGWDELGALVPGTPEVDAEVAEQVVTDIKYAGYLRREQTRAAQTRRMAGVRLPADMSFRVPGVSHEIVERLEAARPETLGQAARLPGVTPAAVDVLAVHLARMERR